MPLIIPIIIRAIVTKVIPKYRGATRALPNRATVMNSVV